MSIPSLFSISAAGIAAVLSIIMLIQGGSNLSLQNDLQQRTQEIQNQQQEVQNLQGNLQRAQQLVSNANQLQQQTGPQVVNALKIVGMRSNNAKIFAMLAKYGVQITDQEKEQIKKMIEDAEKNKGAATAPKPAN
ncbi:MAG TPA: hypothetical protein VFD27_17765 [Chthoniobacteraceae bacterium]|jgi:hypothetical protein|nr:hypothetical protein [Chthoniobacteraceae bacterium]